MQLVVHVPTEVPPQQPAPCCQEQALRMAFLSFWAFLTLFLNTGLW